MEGAVDAVSKVPKPLPFGSSCETTTSEKNTEEPFPHGKDTTEGRLPCDENGAKVHVRRKSFIKKKKGLA